VLKLVPTLTDGRGKMSPNEALNSIHQIHTHMAKHVSVLSVLQTPGSGLESQSDLHLSIICKSDPEVKKNREKI